MNPEIEKLVKLAVADGEITETERAVILRKAEKLGEDIDEVELILGGELALQKKETETNNKSKSNKEGVIKKCPSCGATVPSFSAKCTDCGLEFRQSEATKSLKDFFSELNNVENEERARPRSKWELDRQLKVEQAIANRKSTIISSFPLSNTKEDILEFLTMATSEVVNSPSWLEITRREPQVIVWRAWKSKCQQVILKARFSMKDDKSSLDKIEQYAKRLRIK